MKCKFYLFGFVFSALIALMVFYNSKKGLERQESTIERLEFKIEELEQKLSKAKNENE